MTPRAIPPNWARTTRGGLPAPPRCGEVRNTTSARMPAPAKTAPARRTIVPATNRIRRLPSLQLRWSTPPIITTGSSTNHPHGRSRTTRRGGPAVCPCPPAPGGAESPAERPAAGVPFSRGPVRPRTAAATRGRAVRRRVPRGDGRRHGPLRPPRGRGEGDSGGHHAAGRGGHRPAGHPGQVKPAGGLTSLTGCRMTRSRPASASRISRSATLPFSAQATALAFGWGGIVTWWVGLFL